jgi:hypothetical protein
MVGNEPLMYPGTNERVQCPARNFHTGGGFVDVVSKAPLYKCTCGCVFEARSVTEWRVVESDAPKRAGRIRCNTEEDLLAVIRWANRRRRLFVASPQQPGWFVDVKPHEDDGIEDWGEALEVIRGEEVGLVW